MARTILITGGSSSGKTRWAISYFANCDDVLYISTNDEIEKDTLDRMNKSIELNRVKWQTLCSKSTPAETIDGHVYYIYDNLAGYTSYVIDEMSKDKENITEEEKEKIEARIIDDVNKLVEKAVHDGVNLIIITFETTFSVRPENNAQRIFRDVLGTVNQRVANSVDEVYMSVSGIQMKIK